MGSRSKATGGKVIEFDTIIPVGRANEVPAEATIAVKECKMMVEQAIAGLSAGRPFPLELTIRSIGLIQPTTLLERNRAKRIAARSVSL